MSDTTRGAASDPVSPTDATSNVAPGALANGAPIPDLAHTPEVNYPAAPWRMSGQFWAGVFRGTVAARLPGSLKPLGGPYWRVLALVRYRAGTLAYDELLFGAPARHGLRVGVYVEGLWVDSVASLWGGRRIWGLPKLLARFTWEDGLCQITDHAGPIVTLSVNQRPSHLPPLPLTTAGIGRLGDRWAFVSTPMWARLGAAHMRARDWSPRFAATAGTLSERPWLALMANPMRVRFPAPTLA